MRLLHVWFFFYFMCCSLLFGQFFFFFFWYISCDSTNELVMTFVNALKWLFGFILFLSCFCMVCIILDFYICWVSERDQCMLRVPFLIIASTIVCTFLVVFQANETKKSKKSKSLNLAFSHFFTFRRQWKFFKHSVCFFFFVAVYFFFFLFFLTLFQCN